MIISRRRLLVRAGLTVAAAPFIVRASSLMKIVAQMPGRSFLLPLPDQSPSYFLVVASYDALGKLTWKRVPYSPIEAAQLMAVVAT